MIKILTKLFCLLLIVIAFSCKTNRIDSPRQLLAREFEILEEFLRSEPETDNPNKLTVKELWTQQAIDTVDNSPLNGIIYFELETGTGEPVSVGKEVGYRYNRYMLDRDSIGNAGMFLGNTDRSNYGNVNPQIYVVGGTTQIPEGVQQAISLMRKYGKSRVIVPSVVGGGYYVTSIYDLEVTYLSK